MKQQDVQTWNDAVAACLEAAMAEVDALEAEAGDGMPSPARTVVRAVSRQFKQGDDRRRLDERQSATILELLTKPG